MDSTETEKRTMGKRREDKDTEERIWDYAQKLFNPDEDFTVQAKLTKEESDEETNRLLDEAVAIFHPEWKEEGDNI